MSDISLVKYAGSRREDFLTRRASCGADSHIFSILVCSGKRRIFVFVTAVDIVIQG